MILTFMADERKEDIIVKPEQRIGDVYRTLCESCCFPACCREVQMRVYSVRKRAYVNPMLTFCQSEIFHGDILMFYVKGKAEYEDPDSKK